MLKALLFPETMFADLGFDYVGPIDGHDIHALTRIFVNLRNMEGPVVVHVTTRKGKGYPFAEEDPTRFHGITPFSLVDGKVEESVRLTYTEAFSQSIMEAAQADSRVVAITAAMTDGTGLRPLAARFPGPRVRRRDRRRPRRHILPRVSPCRECGRWWRYIPPSCSARWTRLSTMSPSPVFPSSLPWTGPVSSPVTVRRTRGCSI